MEFIAFHDFVFGGDTESDRAWPLFLTQGAELIATRSGNIYRLEDIKQEPAILPIPEPEMSEGLSSLISPPRRPLPPLQLPSFNHVKPFDSAVWLKSNELVTIANTAGGCELNHYKTDFSVLKTQLIEGSCRKILHNDAAIGSGDARPVVVVTAINGRFEFTVY